MRWTRWSGIAVGWSISHRSDAWHDVDDRGWLGRRGRRRGTRRRWRCWLGYGRWLWHRWRHPNRIFCVWNWHFSGLLWGINVIG